MLRARSTLLFVLAAFAVWFAASFVPRVTVQAGGVRVDRDQETVTQAASPKPASRASGDFAPSPITVPVAPNVLAASPRRLAVTIAPEARAERGVRTFSMVFLI